MKLDSSYGSMAQRAVNYVLDDENAFKVFLQDGRVEMHNNAVERMFRHLAMGRRNWLHTGSHLGAENIAFDCRMQLVLSNYKTSKKVDAKAA